MNRGLIMAALALAVLVSGCSHPTTRTSGSVVMKGDKASVAVVFSDHDRRLIDSYYREAAYGHKGLPPGLAKKGKVPPGHAKRLQRNDVLPPGLRGDPLPIDLERRLSRLPDGYLRVRIGTDIVLMNGRTRVMVDVINDIIL